MNIQSKNKGLAVVIVLVIVVLVLVFAFWYFYVRGGFNLPVGVESVERQVTIEKDGEMKTKDIMESEGVKHSVPLDEIVSGGPPRDGIPPIDDPKFVSNLDVDYLDDSEPGMAVSINGISRFYPYQIMVWHEIVNDTFNNQRVLVTYCPLCYSGIVFDPVVDGEQVEFGTSGKLWNSNLVMYDRKTDSLWSQIGGNAIVGSQTGSELDILPSDLTTFEGFKKTYPDGEVLSQDTGTARFYGRDPYGDYYTTPGTFFSVANKDDRLSEKDFIFGIVVNEKAKAYYPEAIKQQGRIEDEFEGVAIVGEYNEDLDAVQLFEEKENGDLERINPFQTFWFTWAAIHPETELFK